MAAEPGRVRGTAADDRAGGVGWTFLRGRTVQQRVGVTRKGSVVGVNDILSGLCRGAAMGRKQPPAIPVRGSARHD